MNNILQDFPKMVGEIKVIVLNWTNTKAKFDEDSTKVWNKSQIEDDQHYEEDGQVQALLPRNNTEADDEDKESENEYVVCEDDVGANEDGPFVVLFLFMLVYFTINALPSEMF